MPPVSVCRPLLPSHAALGPYLDRMDQARWYSNFGPLHDEFTARLAAHFGVDRRRIVLGSNATAALTATMMHLAPGLCLMPSWTFVASAHAAAAAGLTPFFADVEEANWALTPAIVRSALSEAPGPVRAVLVVAPFGAPLDLADWEQFQDDTGIAVIVDAAAGFDTARASRLTTVISLHATKSLPAGEGAIVMLPDADGGQALMRRLNFGFYGSRSAEVAGLNAKLSEYHCAVGLAALDEWPERRAAFASRIQAYRRLMPGNAIALQSGFGEDWIGATLVARVPDAAGLGRAMSTAGVETRNWWADGCHRQPVFIHCPRTAVPVTEQLARTTLGLPLSLDISDVEIQHVAHAVGDFTAAAGG